MEFLREKEYMSLDLDLSVFYKYNTLIIIYINNLLITNLNIFIINKLKVDLLKRFYITNIRPYIYYLNIIITYNKVKKIVILKQKTYLKKVFK